MPIIFQPPVRRIAITLRLDASMMEELTQVAQEAGRSRTEVIEAILAGGLKEYWAEKKGAKKKS